MLFMLITEFLGSPLISVPPSTYPSLGTGVDSGNFHVESKNEANLAESWGELDPQWPHLNPESGCTPSLHLDLSI